MTLTETAIPGAWLIDADIFEDERGSFVRSWVAEELEARGLDTRLVQSAIATNRTTGTLRGLHYQAEPDGQAKLVQPIRGRIFDVIVDMRPDRASHRRWDGFELDSERRQLLYLPRGVAHGYQTLTDDAEVMYFVTAAYAPDSQRGVRWDDPSLGIAWPITPPTVITPRDASYPDLT